MLSSRRQYLAAGYTNRPDDVAPRRRRTRTFVWDCQRRRRVWPSYTWLRAESSTFSGPRTAATAQTRPRNNYLSTTAQAARSKYNKHIAPTGAPGSAFRRTVRAETHVEPIRAAWLVGASASSSRAVISGLLGPAQLRTCLCPVRPHPPHGGFFLLPARSTQTFSLLKITACFQK